MNRESCAIQELYPQL